MLILFVLVYGHVTVSLQIMHSANLDRCRYLHKVLAVWYIHLGLCEAIPVYSLEIFQPRVTECRSLTPILTLSFEVPWIWTLKLWVLYFLWHWPLMLRVWFSVTLTSDAGSLVYCDLDLFCLEFSFCNFDLLCWEFGFLWPWHLMKGVRFSVTLLSEAGILVSCNYDLSCWEFGFCDFDRLVSSVIIKFWTYGSITR